MKRILPYIIILGLTAVCGGTLQASIIVVQDSSEAALRAAVINAATGDVITFNPGLNSEITLNNEIVINKSLTILGRADGQTTIRGNNCPVFNIQRIDLQQKFSIEIINLTLRDSAAIGENGQSLGSGGGGGGGCGMGGALYFDGSSDGTLLCDRVHFINNKAVGGNGGVGGGWHFPNDGGKGGNGSHGFNNGGAGGQSYEYKDGVGREIVFGAGGGPFSGGGGGAGESSDNYYAGNGGDGNYGGGGGGGGYSFSFSTWEGFGGSWAGKGGDFFIWYSKECGGGGGGAGLGGAIFVKEGVLIVANCEFNSNFATGGSGGTRAGNGQGKGGAIFSMTDTQNIKIYNTTFSANGATNSSGNGFVSGNFTDTSDVYGRVTSYDDIPMSSPSVTVTSALDENYGNAKGIGVTLRDALRLVASGGEILISESSASASLTIDPAKGYFLIEKNVKIKSLGKEPFVIDGNKSAVFFVKSGHLLLQNIKIINAKTTGGNGGFGHENGIGGGGAAGMGGAVFVNSNAFLTCINAVFVNCMAQGGKGGDSLSSDVNYYEGGGGGGIGGNGQDTMIVNRRTDDGIIYMDPGYGGSGWPLSYELAKPGEKGNDGAGGGGLNSGYGLGGFGGGGGGIGFGFSEEMPSNNEYPVSNGGFGGGGGGTWFRGSHGVYYLPAPLKGGLFGGDAPYFAGGGGAGLGGAIFVREYGKVFLDHCEFLDNTAKGGPGGNPNIPARYYENNTIVSVNSTGQGKGGGIFVMDNAMAKVRNCVFNGKTTANAGEIDGFVYNMSVDTPDIYGVLNELSDSDISAFPGGDGNPVDFWFLYDDVE